MKNGKEVSLVEVESIFNSKPSKREKNILLNKEENKFIEEQIPKFNNRELVDNEDVLICEDKCVILNEG